VGLAGEPGIFEQGGDGATPLTLEEARGLIPAYIAFRHELNAAEQANIARGQEWALGRQRDLLTEKFVRDLHRHMLGEVWRWAGKLRLTERNLGVEFWRIPAELRLLLEDARVWVEASSWPADEIAVRFHHRLVSIHPFPNGNGRHSRLMADLLAMKLGRPRFSWGRRSLSEAGEMRRGYIEALRAADRHDLSALVAFARS
jgi:Fic-DOC domain mobile mystery protein B